MEMEHVTISLNATAVRNDTMEGREYLVVPMVMLTEGVHNGSKGSRYYPVEELAKTPMAWNMKPVVVYHPTINGRGVSACDPLIVDKYKIGLVMNTEFDASANKLKAEAWIEVDRANAVDPRIMKAIDSKQPMELSTGLFTDDEPVDGVWNDESYECIARNYRPDHLALLPDQRGACSLADGAGFLVANAVSAEDTYASLSTQLVSRYGESTWITDVFSDFVVFSSNRKLWSLSYSSTDDVIALSDDMAVEVRRNVQYRYVDGTLIGNSEVQIERSEMKKAEMVDALIANESTQWKETDRDGLLAMNEEQLQKMAPAKEPEAPATPPEPDVTKNANTLSPSGTETAPAANEQQITLDQLPPEMQAVYNHGLMMLNKQRQDLIEVITKNEANTFTPEVLANMDLLQLEGIAALAVKKETEVAQAVHNGFQPLFGGAAGSPAPSNNTASEEPLGLPEFQFN